MEQHISLDCRKNVMSTNFLPQQENLTPFSAENLGQINRKLGRLSLKNFQFLRISGSLVNLEEYTQVFENLFWNSIRSI